MSWHVQLLFRFGWSWFGQWSAYHSLFLHSHFIVSSNGYRKWNSRKWHFFTRNEIMDIFGRGRGQKNKFLSNNFINIRWIINCIHFSNKNNSQKKQFVGAQKKNKIYWKHAINIKYLFWHPWEGLKKRRNSRDWVRKYGESRGGDR